MTLFVCISVCDEVDEKVRMYPREIHFDENTVLFG